MKFFVSSHSVANGSTMYMSFVLIINDLLYRPRIMIIIWQVFFIMNNILSTRASMVSDVKFTKTLLPY